MRIGFFTDTYTPQINGVVTSITLFKTALEARGHEVFVFAPTPETPEDADDTVRFRSLPFVFQPEMRMAAPVSLEALRLLDEVDLDVVHAHDPFAIGLFGLRVARRHKIPYVHTYHTLYPEYVHYVWETRLTKRLAERLSREYCDACDSIIAPSSKVEDYLREWGVKGAIEILATGVDIDKYTTVDEVRINALRAKLKLKPEDRVALFMGRLGREKNVEALIRAFWHCRCEGTKLVICGDGPHRAELAELVDELALKNRVLFAGYLEGADTVAAYHLADLFAFASTTETQGLVVAEAMSAGLPVVAAEDRAVEDFVSDGETGLVVPGRPEDLAHAFDALLENEPRRKAYADAAAARARDFSIEHQAEKLERHYLRDIEFYEPRTILPRFASLSNAGLPGAQRRIPRLPRRRKAT